MLYTFHSLSLPTQSFRTRWGHWGERTWSRTRKKGTERKSEETAFKCEKYAVRIKVRQNLIAKNYQRHMLARPQKGSSLLSWLHTSSSTTEPSSHRRYFSPAVQASRRLVVPPSAPLFSKNNFFETRNCTKTRKTAMEGKRKGTPWSTTHARNHVTICIASAFFKHTFFRLSLANTNK